MNFINKNKSPNFNSRKKGTSIKYIIIHYTAIINYRNAIDHLVDKKNKVSAHFLINKVGEIYNLVDIDKRAWHAGISYWKGSNDINSESLLDLIEVILLLFSAKLDILFKHFSELPINKIFPSL